MFISYAQNFEDVMLWRALKHVKNGFYVDVGAAWPEEASVTKAFYDHNWRGINIEPNLEMWRSLTASRPDDTNLNLALSDRRGYEDFYSIDDTGLSTLIPEIVSLHEAKGLRANKVRIEVSTLADVWRANVGSRDVHFLKIDVEGAERQVLQGNDWFRNRPWIVVIEATVPTSQVSSHDNWESIILSSNYQMAYDDGLNRFYVASEHQDILLAFSSPPNVFDRFVLADRHKAEARAKASEVRAKASEARAQETEARAKASEARAHEAEARAKAAEVRTQDAEARVRSAEDLARRMELHGQAVEKDAQAAEILAREAQSRLHQVAAHARTAKARARKAQARAEKARTQLARMKSTLSWRATRPIRIVGKFVSRRLNASAPQASGRQHSRQKRPRPLSDLWQRVVRYVETTARRAKVTYGNHPYCHVCATFVQRFVEHRGRFNARCPNCGSLERHRFSVMAIQKKFGSDQTFRRILHIAPERAVGRYLRSHAAASYVTMDLYAPKVSVNCDIAQTPFCSDEFDLIYCSHVLEHVPHDRAAMKELYRILAPQGLLVVMVPIGHGSTDESPEKAASPELRALNFGQDDHVRRYGLDIVDRLNEAEFKTFVASTDHPKYSSRKRKFGLLSNDFVFFAEKKIR